MGGNVVLGSVRILGAAQSRADDVDYALSQDQSPYRFRLEEYFWEHPRDED